jgi:hypothetical protein
MGLFSFFNQLNNNSEIQDDKYNLIQNLWQKKDKQITYENLCCSDIPKDLRNLFFEFYAKFIQDTTSKSTSVNSHISLQSFIEILIHRYDLPFFIPIVSFIYINRFQRIPNAPVILSKFSPNRLIAVAIIVASKYYLEDTIYIRNSRWISKVCMGLFRTGELNALESLFLRSLDYNINVSYLEWEDYLKQIDNGIHELKLKYNHLNGKELENENNIIDSNNNKHNDNNNNNSTSSTLQPIKNENPIENIKHLFSLLDNHILKGNQLISYDPSLEPNFSVLFNHIETPSNTISSSPQPNYIHNNEIQKIKENLDTNNQSKHNNQINSSYNNKIMKEDELIIEDNNRKESSYIEDEDQDYSYSGILTPPSSSAISQSIYSSEISKNNIKINIDDGDKKEENCSPSSGMNNIISSRLNTNSSSLSHLSHNYKFCNCHGSHTNTNPNTNINIISDFDLKNNQKMPFSPNFHLKTNTLSSLFQHNPDLKIALENYSVTGRLTANHSNHYAGNRYHPFSRQNKNVKNIKNITSETKKNGLPLFSPIKVLDKAITAVSPFVSSLLNKHSQTKTYNNKVEDPCKMFVSPSPNYFNNENHCPNIIRSFSILDSNNEQIKKCQNQNQNGMTIEGNAFKYSILESEDTKKHNTKDKDSLYKFKSPLGRNYESRSRCTFSPYKNGTSNTSTSSYIPSSTPISPQNKSSSSNFTSDTNTTKINLGLGISKKSKLISKNQKINLTSSKTSTKVKDQKLITSYLSSLKDFQPGSSQSPFRKTCSSSTSSSTNVPLKMVSGNTAFIKRFSSFSKLLNKFNIGNEQKAQ